MSLELQPNIIPPFDDVVNEVARVGQWDVSGLNPDTIYTLGLGLAREGRLEGRAALKILYAFEQGYFHGTPLAPPGSSLQSFEPRECQTGDNVDTAFCSSATPYFPTIRSLFHSDQPALRDFTGPYFLRHRQNLEGQTYAFTTSEAVQALEEADAVGWVYPGCMGLPYESRMDIEEHRMYRSTSGANPVKVGLKDIFPYTLVVMEAGLSATEQLNFLEEAVPRGINPFNVANHMGMSLSWLTRD